MQPSLEALANLATIAGTVSGVFALIHSSAWLALACSILTGCSVAAGSYARQLHRQLRSSSVVIEGHSIDALNAANLRRRIDRNFFVQEVALHGSD